MLSRTADHVYWLGRFAERAEGLARTLDVQCRLSLLPQDRNGGSKGWLGLLRALGAEEAYLARYDEPDAQRVVDFLAYDKSNPGSIMSCLRAARDNARAVRGSISSEMWETFNATWLESRALEPGRFSTDNVAEFVDWVKARAHLARGVVLASMLRDEAYHFMQIGTFLERVDSVARMLLIRLTCEQSADEAEGEGAAGDYYSWSVLLRGLSAFESFRRVSRDSVRPRHVLEFVILHPYVPRSLYRSSDLIHENLQSVANAQSGETERRAGLMHAELRYGSLDSLAPHGTAAYLSSVLLRVDDLSDRIQRDFLGHTV